MSNKRRTKVEKNHAAMEYLAGIDERETLLMVNSIRSEMNEDAKKTNGMYWIDATEELPEQLHKVFLKITWRKKLIRDVGFYSDERKEFFAAGGTFKPKFVQWLKNDSNQQFFNKK